MLMRREEDNRIRFLRRAYNTCPAARFFEQSSRVGVATPDTTEQLEL